MMNNEELNSYLKQLNIPVGEFTSQEKLVLNKILNQLEKSGKSSILDSLWLEDYEEKPVNIRQFIMDPFYIGNSTNNGQAIWPSWLDTLSDIFSPTRDLTLLLLSGAIGTGKSTVACIGLSYITYKLLCLKDPSRYYNIMPGSKPGIALFNITLNKGEGVAFHKLNTIFRSSPWFLKHGQEVGNNANRKIFIPDKNVTISIGSNADHFIGLDIFACLHGDTLIRTQRGIFKLKNLVNKSIYVYCKDFDGNIVLGRYATTVKPTKVVTKLLELEFKDKSIIKCTEDHKFMVKDGTYKAAINLTEEDGVIRKELKIVPPTVMYDVVNVNTYHNFLVKTNSGYIVSHNCMMDEVSFKDNKELELTQMKAYDAFTNITRRMESRFMDEGKLPGMAIICSSTRDESDFLSQLKERECDKPNVLLIERPLWESVPKERYCGKTFKLILSNKSTEAFILKDDQNIEDYNNIDYDIYDVPIEHYDSFNTDIYGAIRDILGKALKTSNRFLLQEKVDNAINPSYENVLRTNLIPLGLKDGSSICDYIDLSKINTKLIKYPLFVHHDLSLSGDKTGIFGYAVANDIRKEDLTNQDETNSWMFIPVFWCRVIPDKQGQQIPLYKIRSAIIELRDKYGFNILGVSADGYQSADMLQQYQLNNFNTFLISLDRAPSTVYQFFRSSLYSNQIILPKDDALYKELVGLVENRAASKVDHTATGCFVGETKIKLATSNKCLSILDLLKDKTYVKHKVFTVNESTGNIELNAIKNVFKTKTTNMLLRIYLSDNSFVECTPEHLFMLNDGCYIRAQHLLDGMFLKSLFGDIVVQKKEVISRTCDVYDLEIENNHNFSLESGIFVHNSKDLSDACAGSIYCAVEYNKKFKNKLFSNGGYLFTDVLLGANNKNESLEDMIKNDDDDLLKEIGKGLFSEFDELNSFNIY